MHEEIKEEDPNIKENPLKPKVSATPKGWIIPYEEVFDHYKGVAVKRTKQRKIDEQANARRKKKEAIDCIVKSQLSKVKNPAFATFVKHQQSTQKKLKKAAGVLKAQKKDKPVKLKNP